MERRKEERKKELERRRLEREREKAKKQSSPTRLLDLVVPDAESDHEEFEPWEELDEAQSSPRSDTTVSGLEDMLYQFCDKTLKRCERIHFVNISSEVLIEIAGNINPLCVTTPATFAPKLQYTLNV